MTAIPSPRVRNAPTVYLDFDGVLHPQDVWLHLGEPYVRSPGGHRLFEHADVLGSLLLPYPAVKVVLSTNWVRRFGYLAAAAYLPGRLRARCVGATWHPEMEHDLFDRIPRGEQVLADVGRRAPPKWLALDDDTRGWGGARTTHLIATHPVRGLCDPEALEDLRHGLKRFAVTA
jgi:hypothetical protein